MKKIIQITEEQVSDLKNSLNKEPSKKLAPFIFKRIKNHQTSLGDNEALPPGEDAPFEYTLIKDRYIDVIDRIMKLGTIDNFDTEYLSNRLSSLITKCIEIETPIRSNLEKICSNAVLRLFDIPIETVDFKCELVDAIKPQYKFRIEPEISSKRDFDFNDIDDFNNSKKVVLKRRLINALIQGASYLYSTDTNLFGEDIKSIDSRLIPLYKEITLINDYLLFNKEEKITDKNTMQGGCVELVLGDKNEKVAINAQGLIFPFLLFEMFKGFMELFASHGLPVDDTKAKYIMGQADFLIAEPWDLRIGVKMWERFYDVIDDTNVIPFLFSDLCRLPVKDFNEIMREFLANTVKGQNMMDDLISTATDELNGQGPVPMLPVKDAKEALIIDNIFTSDELTEMINKVKK